MGNTNKSQLEAVTEQNLAPLASLDSFTSFVGLLNSMVRTNGPYIKAHLGLSSLAIDVIRPDPNVLLDWLNKNRPLEKATVLVQYTLINQSKPRESMIIYSSGSLL